MKKRLTVVGNLIVLVVLGLVNLSEGAIRKGPYLIYPGNNTKMMVLWQLDSSQSCTLEWGPDTSYSDGNTVTTEYGTDHQHKHTITDLTPGSKYYYRVTVDLNQYTGSFRAAPPEDANSIKFLGYGDTRTNIFDHNMVDKAIIEAFEADPNYQTFTLLSGDWVNKGERERDWDYEFFNRSLLSTIRLHANLPINGCIGNHEYDDDSNPPTFFNKYWPYPYVSGFYWSFDYGPVHIAVIDQYEKAYNPGSAQYNWLRNDLATANKPWRFLHFHKPGYSAGHHGDEDDVQDYIQPLCERYGVDMVFCGHNHYYARCDKNGVKHITGGGGGAPLRNGSLNYSEYVEVYVKTYHFCKIDIRGDELNFEAVAPDGTVIDAFTIRHPSSQAWNPLPADGETKQCPDVVLSWRPGLGMGRHPGDKHYVYFGYTFEDVNNAVIGSSEYCCFKPVGWEHFDPNVDTGIPLQLWQKYYWRIDEKLFGRPAVKGDIWTFGTGCEIMPGDINLDCAVNIKDLVMLADDWGVESFFPDDF
jgi:hypothetical protein